MPEILDDRVDDVFAQFRAEARTEIVPPGTTAAHHTVSRRRATRAVTVGALSLAVLVGAGVLLGQTNRSHGVQPGESTAPPTSTAPSNPTSDALGLQALARLGYGPAGSGLLPIRPGILYGVATGETSRSMPMVGAVGDPLPAGDYSLTIACEGPGSITVAWHIPANGLGDTVSVTCADGPEITSFPLSTGDFELTVAAPKGTPDPIGFAIVATDPRIILARNARSIAPTQELFGAESLLDIKTQDEESTGFPAGTYELIFACAGGGKVKVTFSGGAANDSKPVDCPVGGAGTQLSITTTKPVVELVVTIDPDVAPYVVAYSYAAYPMQ